jgi:hypothetical protein
MPNTTANQENDMTTTHSPTPARSDLDTVVRRTEEPTARPFRWHGLALSGGALLWAVSFLLFGPNPTDPTGLAFFGLMSGSFQLGLLALLRVLWRTQALGEGRIARAVLRVETVFVALAICSTFVDAIGVSDLSRPGWLLLDAFWPFSMLGMFLIGIRIAVAGRWKGLTRFWPLVAESWAFVVIPTMGIFGEDVAKYVAALHLVVGYTVLGLLVSRKEL